MFGSGQIGSLGAKREWNLADGGPQYSAAIHSPSSLFEDVHRPWEYAWSPSSLTTGIRWGQFVHPQLSPTDLVGYGIELTRPWWMGRGVNLDVQITAPDNSPRFSYRALTPLVKLLIGLSSQVSPGDTIRLNCWLRNGLLHVLVTSQGGIGENCQQVLHGLEAAIDRLGGVLNCSRDGRVYEMVIPVSPVEL